MAFPDGVGALVRELTAPLGRLLPQMVWATPIASVFPCVSNCCLAQKV